MFLSKTHRGDGAVAPLFGGTEATPLLPDLDLLARMPIPLRRPFKQAAETVARRHGLRICALMGGEWYAPFDGLTHGEDPRPAMVVTPWTPEVLCDHLLRTAEPSSAVVPSTDAACPELIDPLGAFGVFAAIPLVFLVDHARLAERAPPRCWADLLGPDWRGDVVFGGWRPHAGVPFSDYNQFLLLCLLEEFGEDGVRAFAASVKGLQHNVVSARTAGGEGGLGGAVTILPWMQAEMAPRRRRVSVVWPEDGAYAMPIGFVQRPEMAERLRPLLDTLIGAEFGRMLARNCYPPTTGAVAGVFPAGASVKWPGWERVRQGGMAARAAQAGRLFFASWGGD